MKTLTEFIIEAKKSNVAEYNKNEIESAYSGNDFKLMLGRDDESECVFIKPSNSKMPYDKIPDDFYVSRYKLREINKELADKIWLVSLTYEKKANSRIKDLSEDVLCPIVGELGMFWNSKQKCNKFIKENRNVLKRDYKKAKVSALTLSEFIDLCEEWSKKYSWSISNLQFYK